MDVLNTIIIPVTAATREPITTRTAKDIARQKIEYYQNMEEKERPRNMKDTIHCWHKRTIRETMPCLSQAATVLLACKPSSGELECDFGLLKDAIAPKRAWLGQGMVEIEMMLKLNQNLLITHPSKVKKLPNDTWKEFIPARLTLDIDDDDDNDNDSFTNISILLNDDEDSVSSALSMLSQENCIYKSTEQSNDSL
jgi:hypothetical protein